MQSADFVYLSLLFFQIKKENDDARYLFKDAKIIYRLANHYKW